MLSRAALLPAAVAVLLLSSSCFGGGDDGGDSLPTNTPDAPLSTPTDEVAGEETPGGNGTPGSASPTPSGPQTHTVQAGEFLSTIAPLYGVTVDEILAANDISDPNVIFPGQELIIPEPGSSPPTTTPDSDDSDGEDDTPPTEEATANSS